MEILLPTKNTCCNLLMSLKGTQNLTMVELTRILYL